MEENTPAETEVALDPELLGKVFENLLAAYNPETRVTARKQTGSYYTPRRVVDYMVDEALVTALAERAQPDDGDADFWRKRLHYLLDYEDEGELFEEDDAEAVVQAIADLKVLDPAVGSGAFPMAVLNKLTLALRRLDSKNELWQKFQIEAAAKRANTAFETQDQAERDAELLEISNTFERYSGDFGRKLYLIQNSIYGADIQTIACQITKLRFFISLAIEQEPEREAENFGIKPLPNLDTRFVAADALLELQRHRTLSSERTRELERQLLTNRERHFHANSRPAKLECMHEDQRLRTQLAAELKAIGFPPDTAKQVASWDPYDQNDVALWFDPKYMFGVKKGFDVVIGNPPYIPLSRDKGKLGKLYKWVGYETYMRTGDIYQLFFEKGCRLLSPGGALAYITSNSWLRAKYGEPLREYLARRYTPLRLLDIGKDVFDAVVDASILTLRSGGSCDAFPGVDTDRAGNTGFPPPSESWGQVRPYGAGPWSILTNLEWSVMEKMKAIGKPLKDWDDVSIYRGILTGYNAAFLVDGQTRNRLVAEDPRSEEILKPILRGRDIQRYRAEWAGIWLISTLPSLNIDINDYPAVKRHLLSYGKERLRQSGRRLPDGRKARKKTPHHWFELQDTCAYHEDFAMPKLLWIELAERGRFAYDESGVFADVTVFMMTGAPTKLLCAVLNSRLIQWFLQHCAPTSGMGALRWKKTYIEHAPIPDIEPNGCRSLTRLVDRILRAKDIDPGTDTSEVETEIDRQVYELYGLSATEIRGIMSQRPV